METPQKLGDLQLAILRVLWTQGEATVAEVHEALEAERGLAPTTIATMLTKMEKKGVVEHTTIGRRFIYRPTVSEGEVRRSAVASLASQMFQGDIRALVNQLLEVHPIDSQELADLRQLIDARAAEGER